ncbi:hypothetical protein [Brucella intermedia]|uniref:Uncharacterized protein n=1 Tax=Brucella intermedia M86 TaxID=1234597 RepID=M5JSB2_9HYPH|nr:hypothetical protein [Brucella intermedia]ELT50995.1 hypothetical protein D584_01338 [Brucella intermedia M86]
MSFKLSKAKLEELRQMEPEAALAEAKRLRDEYNARQREKHAANPQKRRDWNNKHRAKHIKKYRADARRRYAEAKADPERWKALQEHHARERKTKRKRNPEAQRLKQLRRSQRVKTQRLARTDPAELRKLIKAYIPGYLDAAAKMDVINAVILQALDAKVPFNELAAWVKKAVTEYNRQFDHFKNVSIDAPIAGTDDLTRADLIDSEAFHF